MIAARLTFYGACREAVDFYCKVFKGNIVKKTLFEDHLDQFPMGLSDEAKGFFYFVSLQIPDEKGGNYINMGDSPVLAFMERQENQKCRDNVIFDIKLSSDSEVERIYKAFMDDGAKCNIVLCTKDSYSRYTSFIDRFGVCWNVYCENEVWMGD